MTEEEKRIFWELDDKLYLVEKNKTYKKLFKFYIRYNSNEVVQQFIDKLIAWYYVKYSDRYINLVMSENCENILFFLNKDMSFNKLKDRLGCTVKFSHDKEDLYYKYLVIMAGWGLIYNKNSNPENGLYRATKMIEEFNSYYGWNLNTSIYESIINMDYSLDNPEIVKLLEKRKSMSNKEVKKKKNKLPKIKRLFRR